MATILPNAVNQFIDASGNPLAGGTVFMYIPNSSTPKDTYQDSAGTILNTNPIVLNASGEAIIYGSGAYRQVVYDANGDLIWDQITADTSVGGFAWGGVTTGTANAQVGDASSFSSQDGQQYGFIAGFSNSGPMTINPGGSGAIPVLRDSPLGPVPCVGGEVVADNECTLVYEAARGAFHLTNPAIGTMASQNANAVAITGGTIAGVTISTSTILLKQSGAPTPTAEGDIEWDTNDDVLAIGDGATTRLIIPDPPSTAAGDLIYLSAAKTAARLAIGTAGQALTSNGTAPAWGSGVVLGTSATLSGSSIDITGIPAWVRKFTISIDGMSTNGTSIPILQIGDSGGIETSGYVGAGSTTEGTVATTAFTTGVGLGGNWGSTLVASGAITATLLDASTNTWTFMGLLGNATGAAQTFSSGSSKSLSATLDRVRLTTVGGANTFDAGKWNIQYQ